MNLAYIDSCVWITLVEGLDAYRPPVHAALSALAQDGWQFCTSDAVRLEVLVRPLRMNQEKLAGVYQALLDTNRTLSIPGTLFVGALTIASSEGLKAMDAVHVSIASHHGCGRLVTTDPHFRSLARIIPEGD